MAAALSSARKSSAGSSGGIFFHGAAGSTSGSAASGSVSGRAMITTLQPGSSSSSSSSAAYSSTAARTASCGLRSASRRMSRSRMCRSSRESHTRVERNPALASNPGNGTNRWPRRLSLASIGSRHRSSQARRPWTEAGVPDNAGPDGAQCGAGRVDRPVVPDPVAGIDVPRVARELQQRLFAYGQLHASTSNSRSSSPGPSSSVSWSRSPSWAALGSASHAASLMARSAMKVVRSP